MQRRDGLKLPSSLRFVLLGAVTIGCSHSAPSTCDALFDGGSREFQVPRGDVCGTSCNEIEEPDGATSVGPCQTTYCDPATTDCYFEDGSPNNNCVYAQGLVLC